MKEFFSVYYRGEPFILFSKVHIIALILILSVNVLIYFMKDKLAQDRTDKFFRCFIASALLITELSFQLWCGFTGVWTAEYNLPFHLCSVATIICAVMLYKNSYDIYKLAYFWGLGGAIPAIITPDLSGYNYPHYVFFKFFILHGLIIVSVIYMTFVHSYKLSLKDFINAFIYTNILALVTIPVNVITGGNYLFLCRKPDALTLLDYLGPWPWYIIPMELVVFIMFFMMYLPFAVKNIIEKHKSADSRLNLGL